MWNQRGSIFSTYELRLSRPQEKINDQGNEVDRRERIHELGHVVGVHGWTHTHTHGHGHGHGLRGVRGKDLAHGKVDVPSKGDEPPRPHVHPGMGIHVEGKGWLVAWKMRFIGWEGDRGKRAQSDLSRIRAANSLLQCAFI